MKRFLLDTNIYGLILAAKEFHAIHPFIQEKKDFLKLYGFDIVRHELKEAPSTVVRGVNVRAGLLRIYESFICKEYSTVSLYESLADEYYQTYKNLQGGFTKEKLWNDFCIVACASVKNINIVVSEDNATMCNELALRVYKEVNTKRNISVPAFIGYEIFKQQLRTTLSDPIINNPNKLWIFLGFLNVSKWIWFLFHTITQEKLIYKDFVS